MSKTLQQIFAANPITSNLSTDLMYFVQSPYTPGTDAGMTFANFSNQFVLSTAIINPAHGGTGVNNGSNTLTLGGNTAFSGAFTFTGTITGATTVTFPTSGTLATTAQIPALPVSLTNGGTNASLVANNGGIFYSTGSAGAILSGTATAQQLLLSGASTTPQWSTTTYPLTNTINTLLYASSANVMSALATANSATLITSSGGVPSISQTLPTAVQGNITQLGSQSQALNMNSHQINNVSDPTGAQDAATKNYVDTMATGGAALCVCATTANLTATQLGSGVGATLTNSGAQAAFSVDGVTPIATSRVLVKNQAASQNNGIYLLTVAGSGITNWVLTRALDYDTPSEINDTGVIPVQSGTVNANTGWVNTTINVAVDTTAITYVQFGASYPVSLANGGTNANLTASNGGIVWSNASQLQILSGTSTANQILLSGATATPAWSTTTYPATNAINTIMFASSANVLGVIAAVNGGVLVSNNTGVPSMLANPAAAGKMLQSGNAAIPTWSTPTYPSASGGTGVLLRSDGTNYVATTSTYPNTNAANTLLYASSANVMGALATANSSVLVTDGSGVPSLSTTLPSSISATSIQLTTPVLGTPTSGALTNCTGYTIANLSDGAWSDISGSISLTGFSGSPTITYARAKAIGKTYFFSISITGTSNATTLTITGMPKTANAAAFGALGLVQSTAGSLGQYWTIAASGTTLTLGNAGSSTGWANTGTKGAQFTGFYETT